MGAIPVTPYRPQQENMMDQLMRFQQAKNQQQQGQMQGLEIQKEQQSLKDQQAMTAAMQSWDGKDISALPPLVIKHGGSATAVIGLKSKILEQQQIYSNIAKNDAETGSKQLETLKQKNDMVLGRLNSLNDVPDAQLPGEFTKAASELAQSGLIDPQHAQMAAELAKQDPASIRAQIGTFAKGYQSQSQQMETALKSAQTKEALSRSNEADVNAQKTQQEMQLGTGPMADSKYRFIVQQQKLGRPISADDKAFIQAYEKQKQIVPAFNFNLQNAGATGQGGQPSVIAKAIADRSMKWNDAVSARTPMAVKQALLAEVKGIDPQFNSGDFEVEKKVREKFTSGNVSDQLMAINTAREHMKTFSSLADALDNGNMQLANKIGNEFGVQFGSDKATNFRLASQAFGGEVGKAFDGAGVTQSERAEAQKGFSENMSPTQFRGAIKTVDALLQGKQNSAKQSFESGTKGKPNFGQPSSGVMYARDPQGKLHQAPAGTALPTGWKLENK